MTAVPAQALVVPRARVYVLYTGQHYDPLVGLVRERGAGRR